MIVKSATVASESTSGNSVVRMVYSPDGDTRRHTSFYECNPIAAEHLVSALEQISEELK